MKIIAIFARLLLYLFLLTSSEAYSLDYRVPQTLPRFVGAWHYITVKPGDSLSKLAFTHDISLIDLLKYNPHVSLDKPIHPKQSLLIPNCYWVPPLRQGEILINLATQTLYYQPEENDIVSIYPVTIGKPDYPTPQGEYYIKKKKRDPIWYPPPSIRRAYAAKGKSYPSAVAPGPYNPLGTYVMYLNKPTYLIHTAINARALGGAQSFGCVRMYERDIGQLYPQIKLNTPVRIVDEAIPNLEALHKYCTKDLQLVE